MSSTQSRSSSSTNHSSSTPIPGAKYTSAYSQSAQSAPSQAQLHQKNHPPSAVLISLAAHFLHIPHQLYALCLVSKHFHKVLTQDEIWNKVVRYWFPDADESGGVHASSTSSRGNPKNLKGLKWWRHKWKHLWKNTCVTVQRQLLRTHFEELLDNALDERRNLIFMWYDGASHRQKKESSSSSSSSSFDKFNPEHLGFFEEHSETACERNDMLHKFMSIVYGHMDKDRSRFAHGMSISYFEIPMQYHVNQGADSKKIHRVVRDVLCNPAKYKKSTQFTSGMDLQAAVQVNQQKQQQDDESSSNASDSHTDPYANTITFNMKPVLQSKNARPIINDLTKIKASNQMIAEKIIQVGDRILKVLHQDDDTDTCHFAQVVQFRISQYHTTLIGSRHKLPHHVSFVIVPSQSADNSSDKNYTLNKFCHELATFKLKQLAYTDPSLLSGKDTKEVSTKNGKKKKSSTSANTTPSMSTTNKQQSSKRGGAQGGSSADDAKKKAAKAKKKNYTLLGSVCEVSNLWSQFVGIVDADEKDVHADKMINLQEYALKEASGGNKRKKKKSSS
uniref:F-box domain-containing protein n=1 Tax=Percolomonas cosmopolitus TaxID=63605 RepID=A0A7S1PI11_9EUKA|mmetsp:Transcript_9661/g.35842  ORF Transcript_9661/g.35842 Transcript_9661/m.35842 type:complete len:560 (+) Transcript_9661:1-1680(+)